MQIALPRTDQAQKGGFRLPPSAPPFNPLTYRLFTILWGLMFLLAVAGPIVGFYYRYTEPANNSQLLLGARAGFAVSPGDATLVRFPVGPTAAKAGIVGGDRITAIYGLPLPPSMPVNEEALAEHANDPAYIAMGNVLYGQDQSEVPLTVRDPSSRIRDVTVTTGEQHIDAGSRALGISPGSLVSSICFTPCLPLPVVGGLAAPSTNSKDVVSSIFRWLSCSISVPNTCPYPYAHGRAARRKRCTLRSRQRAPPHRYFAVPARRSFLAQSWHHALPAPPLLPSWQRLREPLRRVHDHCRAVACALPQEDRLERSAPADPVGTARDSAAMLCCAACRLPAII